MDWQYWQRCLALQPHPEGGYYRESYRSLGRMALPQGERPYSTAIYYLLVGTQISRLHRLQSDAEVSPLATGEVDHDRACLVGCTVSPGFEFADFAIGDRATLLAQYPQHPALIERFTPHW